MKKIISLFQRNYDGDRLVRDEVVPGAEWVLAGEGIASRKWDGTCCMIKEGRFFKRYDAKSGKVPPVDFIPAQEMPDPVSGHWPGWVPVNDSDRWHREAFKNHPQSILGHPIPDDTYELCGPKINANPEQLVDHLLIPHGKHPFTPEPPRTFEGIKQFLAANSYCEGIVWHHPDGRMVKIKAKDFGLRRR